MPLVLTPLPAEGLAERLSRSSTTSGIAVRRKDKEFRDSLQAVLDRKQPEIEAILKQYGVPMLPIVHRGAEKSRPIGQADRAGRHALRQTSASGTKSVRRSKLDRSAGRRPQRPAAVDLLFA